MDNFISLSQGHHRSAYLASVLKPQPVDIVKSATNLIQFKIGCSDDNKNSFWDITHRSTVLPEVYPQLPHGPDDRHQALDRVAEHHRLVLQALLLTVARLVNDLHLFDNCALPRLSCPQKQEFHLPAGLLAVHGELPVDLPRPLCRLLLKTGHRAPHPVTALVPCY